VSNGNPAGYAHASQDWLAKLATMTMALEWPLSFVDDDDDDKKTEPQQQQQK
jgi:hypothetical protein